MAVRPGTLGSAYLEVLADTRRFDRDVVARTTAAARRAAAGVSSQLERGVERSRAALARLQVPRLPNPAAGLGEGVEREARRANRALDRIRSGARALAGHSRTVTLVTTAALTAITGLGLRSAATFEQSQIALTGLLQSAPRATAFLRDLQEFAAATPFEQQGLIEASQRLLGVGFAANQVIPALQKIGDVAATLGAPAQAIEQVVVALGRIRGAGRATLGDLELITTNLPGFNAAAAIAARLGVSTAEAMERLSDGGVDAAVAVRGILDGMARFPGAAGAMARQAETLNGLFSTFKDTVGITLTDAFAPLIPVVKDTLRALTPVVGEVLGGLGPALASAVGALAPALVDVVRAVGPFLGDFARVLAPVVGQLLPVLSPLLAVLGRLLGALARPLQTVARFIVRLADAAEPLIVALVDALAPVLEELADVLVAALLPLLPQLSDLFLQLVPALVPVLTALVDIVAAGLPELLKLTIETVQILVPVVVLLANALAAVLRWVTPLVPTLINLGSLFVGFLAASKLAAVGRGLLSVGRAAGHLATPVRSLVGVLGNLVRALPQAARSVGTFVASAVRFFAQLPLLYGRLLLRVRQVLQAGLLRAFTEALSVTRSGVTRVVTSIAELVTRVAGLARRFLNAGRAIGRALFDGLRSAFARIPDLGRAIAQAVRGFLNSTVIDRINRALEFDFRVPVLNRTIGINPPDIPRLAHGAILDRPTLNVAGESGREVVIPLTRPRRAEQLAEQSGLLDLLARRDAVNGGGWPGPAVVQHITLPTGDPAAAAVTVGNRVAALVGR